MYYRFAFRAKTTDTQRWVYGYYVLETFGARIYDPIKRNVYCVDQETVGQCTGLRDKNKKWIYEGDIIESPNGTERRKVYWDDAALGWNCLDAFGSQSRLIKDMACIGWHAIGNIHDNPELMEVELDE